MLDFMTLVKFREIDQSHVRVHFLSSSYVSIVDKPSEIGVHAIVSPRCNSQHWSKTKKSSVAMVLEFVSCLGH